MNIDEEYLDSIPVARQEDTCGSGYGSCFCSCLPLRRRGRTVDVYDDHGGSVAEYDAHWAQLADRGVSVRIVGPCQSACTVLLAHIPRVRICVMPDARFGFHLAHLQSATDILWNGYAPDIRQWIKDHGGLTDDFIWMGAPDTYRYFAKC